MIQFDDEAIDALLAPGQCSAMSAADRDVMLESALHDALERARAGLDLPQCQEQLGEAESTLEGVVEKYESLAKQTAVLLRAISNALAGLDAAQDPPAIAAVRAAASALPEAVVADARIDLAAEESKLAYAARPIPVDQVSRGRRKRG